MSVSVRDPIAFVEACYDLRASDQQWMQQIADIGQPILKVKTLLAYHVNHDVRGVDIRCAVQAGDAAYDVASRIAAVGRLFERSRKERLGLRERLEMRIWNKVTETGLSESVENLLLSERQTLGPRWAYTLGAPGVNELLFIVNHHIDGHGATQLVGSLAERGQLRASERVMIQRLSAHLKAGLRLRRRLPNVLKALEPTEDGAVLDASARLVHAEGEAQSGDARALLEQKAREIDRARTRRSGRDEYALSVWQGLVDGRWSLVERFDADGKRFMLAHKNPEQVVDPRGLLPLESRVTGLAVRGYSDKLIAYHLGVAEGTVSSQLKRALRKLGLSGRIELVRTLGRYYPLQKQQLPMSRRAAHDE